MPSLGSTYIRDISGHTALISNSGNLQVDIQAGSINVSSVNVSGNVVQISGQMVNFASGATANLSGLSVVTSVNVAANVSGNIVYTTSGNNLVQIASGFNQVTISGFGAMSGVAVSTSGNTHVIASGAISIVSGSITVNSGTITLGSGVGSLISGVAVSVSGNNVAFSGVTSVSGQTVFLGSGAVSIVSGSITVNSGTITIGSGIGAQISGAALSVSGNAIQFASGGSLALSGLSVTATVTTNVSGNIVGIIPSWQSSVVASGFSIKVSGAFSGANSVGLYVFDYTNQIFNAWSATTSGVPYVVISGVGTSITSGNVFVTSGFISLNSGGIVLISGQTITQSSGAWMASGIIPNISGQAVSISGAIISDIAMGAPTMTSGFGFSGNALPVAVAAFDFSGQNWVPLNTITSGAGAGLEVGIQPASKIRIGGVPSHASIQSGISSLSGGTALQSGDLYVITLRNLSGNAEMYVGGSGAYPYSGVGFPIGGGDAVTLSVTNANLVSVFAVTSGQRIGWIGSQY